MFIYVRKKILEYGKKDYEWRRQVKFNSVLRTKLQRQTWLYP